MHYGYSCSIHIIHVHFIQPLESSTIDSEPVCVEDTLAKLKGMIINLLSTCCTFALTLLITEMRPITPHYQEHNKKVTREEFLRVCPQT